MPTSMASFAPPAGNQDQRLSFQIKKRWKNTFKIYDINGYLNQPKNCYIEIKIEIVFIKQYSNIFLI